MLELLHATIGTHDLSCGQHWTWHVCSFLGWVEFITEGSSILIGFAPKDHSRLQVIIVSIAVLTPTCGLAIGSRRSGSATHTLNFRPFISKRI